MSNSKLKILARVLFIVLIVVSVALLAITFVIDLLPLKFLAIGAGVMVAIAVVVGLLALRKRGRVSFRIAGIVIAAVFIVLYVVAGSYLAITNNFLGKIGANGKDLVEYSVIVDADSTWEGIENLKDQTVFVTSDLATDYIDAQNLLTEEAAKTQTTFTYDYVKDNETLISGVKDGTCATIFMQDNSYDILCDEDDALSKGTKVLCSVFIEKETADTAKAVDVTQEPFNMYITGLDTFGNINVQSRSDVNMIVSINPKTKHILLTSIPRDYYVKLHTAQAMDKLTHSGIYGADETVATIEDLMGIEINYYFKCNFSTVQNFIDAIGGITVQSDYSFTTHGRFNNGYTFSVGENYVTGETALAFARERYSFGDGDNQRIRNQQHVVEGVIQKLTTSSTLLTNYSSILSSLADYIETNLSDSDIKALVKMQADDMAKWTVERMQLEGSGTTNTCYAAGGGYAYVAIPDETSMIEAKKAMAKVFSGHDVEESSETKTEQ